MRKIIYFCEPGQKSWGVHFKHILVDCLMNVVNICERSEQKKNKQTIYALQCFFMFSWDIAYFKLKKVESILNCPVLSKCDFNSISYIRHCSQKKRVQTVDLPFSFVSPVNVEVHTSCVHKKISLCTATIFAFLIMIYWAYKRVLKTKFTHF